MRCGKYPGLAMAAAAILDGLHNFLQCLCGPEILVNEHDVDPGKVCGPKELLVSGNPIINGSAGGD